MTGHAKLEAFRKDLEAATNEIQDDEFLNDHTEIIQKLINSPLFESPSTEATNVLKNKLYNIERACRHGGPVPVLVMLFELEALAGHAGPTPRHDPITGRCGQAGCPWCVESYHRRQEEHHEIIEEDTTVVRRAAPWYVEEHSEDQKTDEEGNQKDWFRRQSAKFVCFVFLRASHFRIGMQQLVRNIADRYRTGIVDVLH